MVVHDLVRRFRIIAVLNLVLAPFVIVFLFMYFFFRYAEVHCPRVDPYDIHCPLFRWRCEPRI
jgi:hypothetical protein